MASSAILLLSSFLLLALANAATFTVTNKCSYTVWAAAYPGGGKQLNTGQTWSVQVPAGTKLGRIWGRTGCKFDSYGNGNCQTGDCGKLVCTTIGSPPNTVAEFNLNQYKNIDFFYLSLLDGFNIPLDFLPDPSECSSDGIHCRARVNAQCPSVLKTTGGCLNPCQVFKTDEYCCNNNSTCGLTKYSKYFKTKCPQAFTYPRDDASGTFICPGGTNYTVVFCP